MMTPIMASISRKSPSTILPMFFGGEFSHKIEAVFCWVRVVFMGLDYGRSKSYGFRLWE